jgi:hypothetical protein
LQYGRFPVVNIHQTYKRKRKRRDTTSKLVVAAVGQAV